MKIRLLNKNSYCGFEDVEFPLEVEAIYEDGLYHVTASELIKAGAEREAFCGNRDIDDELWPFASRDIEVVE